MPDDSVSRDEFQNFREDVREDFARCHSCDQRIEQKLDNLISRLENQADKRQERSFSTKQGVFLAFVGAVAGTIGAVFTHLLGG